MKKPRKRYRVAVDLAGLPSADRRARVGLGRRWAAHGGSGASSRRGGSHGG